MNELHASGAWYAAQLKPAKKPMRLTAIIPHYNHAAVLPFAVKAMQRSTRPPDQIIVVDDGSEQSEKIAAHAFCLLAGVRFLSKRHNEGVATALNRGIEEADGNVFYFGAADDEVFPNFFEQALNTLQRYPSAGVVAAMGEWVDADGARIEVGYRHPAYFEPARVGDKFIPNHVALYRMNRNLYFVTDAGPFADWLLAQRIAQTSGACFTGTVGGRFNLRSDTYYHRGDRHKAWCTVIGKLIAWGIADKVQLHVLGCGAYGLLPANLRTFRRWFAFRWHALKARLWRYLPSWALAVWGALGGRVI